MRNTIKSVIRRSKYPAEVARSQAQIFESGNAPGTVFVAHDKTRYIVGKHGELRKMPR